MARMWSSTLPSLSVMPSVTHGRFSILNSETVAATTAEQLLVVSDFLDTESTQAP